MSGIKYYVIFKDTTNGKLCRLGLLSTESAQAACWNVNRAFPDTGAKILHTSVITASELNDYKLVATEETPKHRSGQCIGS